MTLEQASRLYQEIVGDAIDGRIEFSPDRLRDWLKRDVFKAVEPYVTRHHFREQASWPIRTYSVDSSSQERKRVDEFKEQLLEMVGAFAEFLRNPEVARIIKQMFDPWSFRLGVSTYRDLIQTPRVEGSLRIMKCRNDLNSKRSSFPVMLVDPSCPPIGDLVQLSFVVRVKSIFEQLVKVRSVCPPENWIDDDQVKRHRMKLERQWEEFCDAWRVMPVRQESGKEDSLRESCMMLTQVYAAFSPYPDLSWLGLSEEVVENSSKALANYVGGRRCGELGLRIAAALEELSKFYRDNSGESQSLEREIAKRRLVLDEKSRTIFWDGVKFNPITSVTKKNWDVLSMLVLRCREFREATESDVFEKKKVGRSTYATAIGRLCNQLPNELGNLIVNGAESRSYRLDLNRGELWIARE